MENVSKALLIAGGILIAIVILTMLLMMFNRMTSIKKTHEEQIKAEQLATFNAQFEAYNKKVMYGADVISLINKVNENKEYEIVVKVPDEIYEEGADLKLFTCTNIEYNQLGRVSKIEINKYEK